VSFKLTCKLWQVLGKSRSEKISKEVLKQSEEDADNAQDNNGPTLPKLSKPNPCVACLGLLQDCIETECLDQVEKSYYLFLVK
jgi:hypothetical protein